MSNVPPGPDQLSDVDHLYRRLSALDPAHPGEWVRRKVQAYAAQQAAERAVRATAKAKSTSISAAPPPSVDAIATLAPQATRKAWVLPVTLGALIAAVVAGFLIVPRLVAPKAALSVSQPAQPSQPETSTPALAQAAPPASREPESTAEISPPAAEVTPHPDEVASHPDEVASHPDEVASHPDEVASHPDEVAPHSDAVAPRSDAVAPRPSAAPAPVASSRVVDAAPVRSPPRTRLARQSVVPAAQSAPISGDASEPTAPAQVAKPAPPAESAPVAQIPTAPSAATPTVSAVPAPPTSVSTPSGPSSTPKAAAAPSAPPDELWLAAKSGDMDRLQAALAGNVNVDALNAKGQTALILAIENNHLAVVRALLAHGANPNIPDARGIAPIQAARTRENFAIVSALERNGRH